MVVDLFWINAIQEFDYCDRVVSQNKEISICQAYSWLYHISRFILMTEPEFATPARTTPLSLSVLVNDIPGATKLFQLAYANHPTDWRISYRYGYHMYSEEKNMKVAANLFYQTALLGGPMWLYSLADKISEDLGADQFRERLLQEFQSQNIDPLVLEKIKSRIKK